MEFERINYDELNQNQGTFNDSCAQFMYDQTHNMGGYFQNSYIKPENTDNQLETIENNQPVHYDIDSYFNSTSFSVEAEYPQFEDLGYQNVHNTCDSRVAMNFAVNKAQDFSKQLPSSEENQIQGFLSTGDSSTSFSHNIAHVPCMDHFNNMGSPFSMNSPMETTAACTPILSVKEEKGDGQNARRNMPVLIVQRVKQSFLDAIPVSGKKARNNGNGGRLDYVYSILNMSVAAENLPAFREFLNSLDFGNKRTWTVIQEQFANKNADFVHVLLDGIERFLSEVGAGDFHAWVEENKKMKAANKKVLYDSKGWFRESFASKFGDNKIHF